MERLSMAVWIHLDDYVGSCLFAVQLATMRWGASTSLGYRNIQSTQESVRNSRVPTPSALLFSVRRRSMPKHRPQDANKEQRCDRPMEPDSVQTGENID